MFGFQKQYPERLALPLAYISSQIHIFLSLFVVQFTMRGGRHAVHHTILLQKAGASRVLRTVAAAATAALQAKVFARIVLRNLEHHQAESNTVVALS